MLGRPCKRTSHQITSGACKVAMCNTVRKILTEEAPDSRQDQDGGHHLQASKLPCRPELSGRIQIPGDGATSAPSFSNAHYTCARDEL